MPTSYPEMYFPVLLQVVIAMAIAALMLGLSFVLGKKVRNPVKDMPYESGIVPTGDARHRVSVKFYMVGMLFILFDIEAIFLYPWAVVYRDRPLIISVVISKFAEPVRATRHHLELA